MSFESNFPAIIYETEEGEYDAYAPPIPIKLHGEPITDADIVKVGTYPDKIVKSLAAERDRKGLELYNSKQNEENMGKKMYRTEEELKQQKVTTKEHMRLEQMWQEKCAILEAMQQENHANSSVEEVEEEDHTVMPNGHAF